MILVAGDFHDSGTMTAWNLLREGKSALEALEPAVRPPDPPAARFPWKSVSFRRMPTDSV